LLYDSKSNGIVYALSNKGKKFIISPSDGRYALIGADKDNHIYIGHLSGSGVISNILKGDLQGNFSQYKPFGYLYPVSSVTVDYNGKIKLS
jgi:hypothetical protein